MSHRVKKNPDRFTQWYALGKGHMQVTLTVAVPGFPQSQCTGISYRFGLQSLRLHQFHPVKGQRVQGEPGEATNSVGKPNATDSSFQERRKSWQSFSKWATSDLHSKFILHQDHGKGWWGEAGRSAELKTELKRPIHRSWCWQDTGWCSQKDDWRKVEEGSICLGVHRGES
jgi:hypothetical protein